MENPSTPRADLAARVLPKPLYRALTHVFSQRITGCVLAGGTALAGFYAGHRRSDDLDFFTESESAQRATVLAIRSLSTVSAEIESLNESNQYFEALGRLDGHEFKITAVVDANLFRVGEVVRIAGDIQVVSADTLFKMKAAALVSRCSEKDLYDLIWLFARFPDRTFSDLVRLGNKIDGEVDAESMLASVSGTILRVDACDFALKPAKTAAALLKEIKAFQKKLTRGLVCHLEAEPTPALGELIAELRRLD